MKVNFTKNEIFLFRRLLAKKLIFIKEYLE